MKELSKELVCLLMRQGVEVWMEKERANNLKALLVSIKESKFIDYDGRLINSADISGIFTAQDMEDYTRRKNGQWKTSGGIWKDRFEKETDADLLKSILNK